MQNYTITQESGDQLDAFLEKLKETSNKIDVVIRTLNSSRTIRDCINSIEHDIPLRKLIIVDGGSTDDTITQIQQTETSRKGDIILIQDKGLSLGDAQLTGVSFTRTPVIACIDSDDILQPGWYQTMRQHLDEVDVAEGGIIEHYTIAYPDANERHRGNENNLLLWKKAFSGIPFSGLNVRCDDYLKTMVQKQGYIWRKTGVLKADHYSDAVRYQNTGTYLQLHRFKMPKEAVYNAAYTDHYIRNHQRKYRLLVYCFILPLHLWVDMMREWLHYMKGWCHAMLLYSIPKKNKSGKEEP